MRWMSAAVLRQAKVSKITLKCALSPKRYMLLTAVKSTLPHPYQFPDAQGHFGPYGGRFVAETLMGPIEALTRAYAESIHDPAFMAELDHELQHYVGRPSPLYYAKRWSERLGGARIYLKREDLNHTGAHKVNNTVGQALLAQRRGDHQAARDWLEAAWHGSRLLEGAL